MSQTQKYKITFFSHMWILTCMYIWMNAYMDVNKGIWGEYRL